MPAADDGSDPVANEAEPTAGTGGADPGSDAGEADSDPGTDGDGPEPGVPATRRNRAKSAILWGLVGGFSFLVLSQGYLLRGGEFPFPYGRLFAVAAAVSLASGGLSYVVERRVAKRRT